MYSTVNYTLRAAVQKAQERNIQQFINTVIRDCFIKQHIKKDFSASLIHRHYDLATDERNKESDGKAVASKNLDRIYPSAPVTAVPAPGIAHDICHHPNDVCETFDRVHDRASASKEI
jgi:hypothetical protein